MLQCLMNKIRIRISMKLLFHTEDFDVVFSHVDLSMHEYDAIIKRTYVSLITVELHTNVLMYTV